MLPRHTAVTRASCCRAGALCHGAHSACVLAVACTALYSPWRAQLAAPTLRARMGRGTSHKHPCPAKATHAHVRHQRRRHMHMLSVCRPPSAAGLPRALRSRRRRLGRRRLGHALLFTQIMETLAASGDGQAEARRATHFRQRRLSMGSLARG